VAGGIIYLDSDDEITSAASRIRAAEGRRVALVLPYGSRVATSRINFRLLSRDALTHEKRLSIVASDAATRALAASAGLPVFGSVAEYETSEEAPKPPRTGATAVAGAAAVAEASAAAGAGATDAAAGATGESEPDIDQASALSGDTARVPTTPARRRTSSRAAAPDQVTLDEVGAGTAFAVSAAIEPVAPVAPVAPVPQTAPVRQLPEPPPPRSEGRTSVYTGSGGRSRTPILAGLGALALVVLVIGVGAYLLLPSATIVVTPKDESVGPVAMTIEADPNATAPDATSDPPVVPAQTVTVDVTAADSFPATGKRVEKAKATGIVRFRNKDFTSSNTVPAGSVVSTPTGVRFRTNTTITVPRANIVGLQVFPKTASVKVTAVEAGPAGNVEPNTIVVIPRGEDPISLDVNNPDATTGGKRDEFPKVTQADVDKALAALATKLDAAFIDQLKDPSIAPPGATVFPETRVLGSSTPTVDPTTVVDQEVASFDLGLTASGTATAVDADPVQTVVEERLKAGIDAGHRLVPGSVDVKVDPAVVNGGRISFPASASARQTAILDPAVLKRLVLGKTLDDARAALKTYGTVDLTAWPDWVSTIPTIDGRVDLTINDRVSVESSSPTPPP
jgi:hypothetical protein